MERGVLSVSWRSFGKRPLVPRSLRPRAARLVSDRNSWQSVVLSFDSGSEPEIWEGPGNASDIDGDEVAGPAIEGTVMRVRIPVTVGKLAETV